MSIYLFLWLFYITIFFYFSEYFLLSLILLEFGVIIFLIFIVLFISFNISNFIILILFRLFVIEGVIGLYGLILLVRFSGSDYIRSTFLIKLLNNIIYYFWLLPKIFLFLRI